MYHQLKIATSGLNEKTFPFKHLPGKLLEHIPFCIDSQVEKYIGGVECFLWLWSWHIIFAKKTNPSLSSAVPKTPQDQKQHSATLSPLPLIPPGCGVTVWKEEREQGLWSEGEKGLLLTQ